MPSHRDPERISEPVRPKRSSFEPRSATRDLYSDVETSDPPRPSGGLSKSASMFTNLSQAVEPKLRRDVTAIHLPSIDRPRSSDPFRMSSAVAHTSSSSSSSTVKPVAYHAPRTNTGPTSPTTPKVSEPAPSLGRGLSRSSTQPSLSSLESQTPQDGLYRNVSIRRASKPPFKSRDATGHNLTSSNITSPISAPVQREPKARSSRHSSDLAAILAGRRASRPSDPMITPDPKQSSSTPTLMLPPPAPISKSPSKPRRAFPAELTRGTLPGSPASHSPLGPARRLPSQQGVRSVEEKKELVSRYRPGAGYS